jgi:hypothetical protein
MPHKGKPGREQVVVSEESHLLLRMVGIVFALDRVATDLGSDCRSGPTNGGIAGRFKVSRTTWSILEHIDELCGREIASYQLLDALYRYY